MKTNDFDKIMNVLIKSCFGSERPLQKGLKHALSLSYQLRKEFQKRASYAVNGPRRTSTLSKDPHPHMNNSLNPNEINFGRNVIEEHKKDFEQDVYDMNPDKEDLMLKLDWDSI